MSARQSVKPPRLGLALGSGSARGWAHLGVVAALLERGFVPDVVTGASVGALVGAAYANGRLAALESWVSVLTQRDVWRLVDTVFRGGGVMTGNRLMNAIAAAEKAPASAEGTAVLRSWSGLIDGLVESFRARRNEPGLFEVMTSAVGIMQERITRDRLAADPPDLVLKPDVAKLQLMDFHRARESIAIGRRCVEAAEVDLARLAAGLASRKKARTRRPAARGGEDRR